MTTQTTNLNALSIAYTLPDLIQVGPNTAFRLNSLACTDAGEAEALALLHSTHIRYDHTRRCWLTFDGVRWTKDENGELERLTLDTARNRLAAAASCGDAEQRKSLAKWALEAESTYRRHAALEAAESLRPLATTSAQYDTDPWLLGCRNGILDLKTGLLRPGQPEDMITKTTGVVYEAGATCDRWLRFLEEVFARDKTDEDKPDEQQELVDYIQRAVGYSLTGNTSEQCFFLCHGDGNNGKSVFLETLRSILGDYAQNTA
ncbi:MAG: hypothetical protein FJ015_07480, partial [Chloroflexi bacterium]|nr:hypothetical protein [Chloroflexota bacterium]